MDSSDDDDSDQKSSSNSNSNHHHHHNNGNNSSYKERRREAHTQAEQKRRDAIKKGYEDLQLLVPTCMQHVDSVSSYKLSKAAILQRSIEYIQTLQQQKHRMDKELQLLRKEVIGLEIMKANYEQMVNIQQQRRQQQLMFNNNNNSNSSTRNQTGENVSNSSIQQSPSSSTQISDETKFEIFKAICDSLFETFDQSVRCGNFSELSACTILWLEEHCKPENMNQIMLNILDQIKTQIHH